MVGPIVPTLACLPNTLTAFSMGAFARCHCFTASAWIESSGSTQPGTNRWNNESPVFVPALFQHFGRKPFIYKASYTFGTMEQWNNNI